jgi:aromatic-L-amino-acid/L-tryptophan decarboxylase
VNPELALPPEQMREMGYRVVDLLVNHLSSLPSQRVGAKGDPAELLAMFSGSAPEQATAFEELLTGLEARVLANTMHVNHPRFFAYVPGPSNFVSVLADAIVSGYNVFAGTWVSGSGAAAIEMETIGWLRKLCGMPETAGGLFVSGGTVANLTALAVARQIKLGEHDPSAVVYCSDQAHSSIEKSLRVLGFSRGQIRSLPCDERFRLPAGDLVHAIDEDAAKGKRPFCIVASAGTTNTGAIDPLPELAQLARSRDLWLHVDGAYGAAAAICDRGRALLVGMGEADSLSLDPHKWLFQPFETGCVLVKRASDLIDTFRILPEYLKDTHAISAEINFTDSGLQLTRSFRALKLWMSIRFFGLASFRAAIERGFQLAEFTEARIRNMPKWEIVTPAQMAVVCFRYRGATDAFHLQLVQRVLSDGFAFVTSTTLRGITSLRMCTINPRTTESDIVQTLEKLDELAAAG